MWRPQHFWKPLLAAWLVGWFITGSWNLGYESRWFIPRYVWHRLADPDPSSRWFTEQELANFNGVNKDLPIYLAVNGMVFDVSSRPETYGPLGSYRFFSGRDAARAYATGCFRTDLTYDLRGLSEAELASVEGWQQFFKNSPRYWHVGYVHHEEPEGDPPEHCRKAQKP